ncbi:MAG: hypothetical protein RLZZ597_2563 [Cyanobacteriota bacterium]|jgi:hypothetical protein
MPPILLALNIAALCVTLAGVETLHGILRNALVAPRIGTKRAKKLSLISGTILLFIVCYLWVPKLGLSNSGSLLALGLLLAIFMALFDMLLGRYAIKLRWRVILKDFDPRQGNYLLFGLLVLVFIPLVVMALR